MYGTLAVPGEPAPANVNALKPTPFTPPRMSLEARCTEAANRLSSAEFLRIISDDDADGIAAAGVLTRALDRANVPFHLTLDRMNADDYQDLHAHDHVVLLDQGSGALNKLATHPGDVTILDHHIINGQAPHALHVNPHLEGYDGTSDCCTSTLAYLTALQLDDDNADSALLALAGMIGDRQDVPQLATVNKTLIERALERGTLTVTRAPPLDLTRPIGNALTTSVDPYLAGISGRARKANAFLEALHLDPDATPRELNDDETRRLTSAIVAHLAQHDVEGRELEKAANRRFTGTLAGRTVTASRLTAMLNASAREGTPGLGIALGHGDADAFTEAATLVEAYEEDLLKGLLTLEREPPTQRDAIQVFDAVDPDLVGAHCGLGMTYVFDKTKPTIGLKTSNGNIKISGRATQALVDAGLDLATALKDAANHAGGNGGGHPIAAGAMIPAKNKDAFVDRLDEIVGDQIHAPVQG